MKKKEIKLPQFVLIYNTALRLVGNKYYRDGGNWSIGYKVIDGKLVSWCPNQHIDWLHNLPIIKISKKKWKEDNGQYAPKNI